MDGAIHKRVSKFLSYVLRHHPESIGLHLDDQGWALIEELSKKADREGYDINQSLIQDLIASGNKQRFILSSDEQYVRATYGHSVEVDLQLDPNEPPVILYHGKPPDGIFHLFYGTVSARAAGTLFTYRRNTGMPGR